MNVPFVDFYPMHNEIDIEIDNAWRRVRKNEFYIMGKELNRFEVAYADYCGTKYAIGCGNGLDSIYLSLKALDIGPGDEVIIPAHTFIATALAVTYNGAKPIFVDNELCSYNIDTSLIEGAITSNTKAILPVHLYGQLANMAEISNIANRHELHLVEDAAQAHGSMQKQIKAGAWGDTACFSFYPGKNLGSMGDGGAIITSDENLASKLRALTNYGSEHRYYHDLLGTNSRLDELQAAILNIKLSYLDKWNDFRNKIANIYLSEIKNPLIILPTVSEGNYHVWHIFAIRCKNRNKLKNYLNDLGIQTSIHYPIPCHLQKAYSKLGHKRGDFPVAEEIAETELSLPMFYGMSDEQIEFVIEKINNFEG